MPPRTASAPGKFILFGEHAVVYGEPAVALAVDLRLTATVDPDGEPSLDGDPAAAEANRYVAYALKERAGEAGSGDGTGGAVTVDSDVPRAVGLGSSAALCTALAAAMWDLDPAGDEAAVARRAFRIESGAQGTGSPIDTSTSTHGSGVVVGPEPADGHLWTLSRKETTWHVHHVDVPDLAFVVGDTGVPRRTQDLVARVAFAVTADPAAKRAISAVGDLARRGVDALAAGDAGRVGILMDQNQTMLARLGVNTEPLQTLIEAAREHALGAKLTGAGGGGSMVALCEDDAVEACADAIEAAGGTPYVVRTTGEGVVRG